MKNKFLLCAIMFVAVVFTACNKAGKTGLLVPKDAGVVFHVDLSSLSSKLSWQEISATNWFHEAQKKSQDSLVNKLLADPESSGIDTKGSLVMFMKRSADNGYMAFEGKLKDASKFSKMVEQTGKGNYKIEKDGNFSYAVNPDNNEGVLYFNDKMFVLIMDITEGKNRLPTGNAYTPGSNTKYSIDSLKYFAKSTFSLKGDDLLDSDKRFAELINDKADMHYWVNSGNLYGGLVGGVMSMMKLNTILDGNISTGKINFENGKIAIDSKQFYGKELASLFKKYGGKQVSSELLSRLPEGDVLAAFAMNFNPEGLKEFLKLIGVDGIANAALGQVGISIDDFIKAHKGDLAFALTGFNIKQTPTSVTLENGEVIPYNKETPDAKFVFGVSVNDKASFQKLVDVIGNKLQSQMQVTQDSSLNHLKNKLQDKWFALGSSDAEVDAFLKGGSKPAYTAAFSGHDGGGYADLQKIIMSAAANNKDTSGKKAFDISAAFWKNINMSFDIKGGEAVSKFDINLVDAGTNALKQLNKYFDQMYLAFPKKDLELDTVAADTTISVK